MFTWLVDEDKASTNPARKVKLPPRQEAGARSLTDEEFVEVYGVAVSTGQDPALDGIILRHLLIQAVRRGHEQNLSNDLACGQIALQTHQRRQTELAIYRTADLR